MNVETLIKIRKALIAAGAIAEENALGMEDNAGLLDIKAKLDDAIAEIDAIPFNAALLHQDATQ